MRLSVIVSDVPRERHDLPGVTAVNVVSWALVLGLADLGHELALQIVFNPLRASSELSEAEADSLARLRQMGVAVLPPVFPADYGPGAAPPRGRFRRLLARVAGLVTGQPHEDFYPSLRVAPRVCAQVAAWRPSATLAIWSPEGVAALSSLPGIPRVSYQGDVDFAPLAARLRSDALFGGGRGGRADARIRAWLGLGRFKKAHARVMRGLDRIACVTATNAEYYARHGHPRALYVQNTWPDPGADVVLRTIEQGSARQSAQGYRPRILGHVGHLNATGGTYGLSCLADVLPELEKRLPGLDYELHVIGQGDTRPEVRDRLARPRVVFRGFVADLDAELAASDAFLLLNNANPYYKSAFTRHVVAWASGLCLVAHADSQRTIPEVRAGENTLLGSTPVEIADAIARAVSDAALNRGIREGGRRLYEARFTPGRVARALSDALEELLRTRPATASRPGSPAP